METNNTIEAFLLNNTIVFNGNFYYKIVYLSLKLGKKWELNSYGTNRVHYDDYINEMEKQNGLSIFRNHLL